MNQQDRHVTLVRGFISISTAFALLLGISGCGYVDSGVGGNLPPSQYDDSYPASGGAALDEGGTLNVAAPGVLANDKDGGNGLTAHLLTDAAFGTLTLNDDGSFTYTHNGGENHTDTFTYIARDRADADSGQATVTLTITPVNDPPVITYDTNQTVNENNAAVITPTVADPAATDPDSTNLIWSIVGGADDTLFTINPTTGAVSFAASPNYEVPLDADADNVYEVTVQVADDGTPSLSDIQTLNVTVDNVNEEPVITSDGGGATADVSRPENTSVVTTVSAADEDVGDVVNYSIAGGADAGLFDIDSLNGTLTFKLAPNYEAPADANHDNTYQVIVQADDGHGGSTSQTVNISVTNVSETANVTFSSGSSASVPENSSGGAYTALASTDLAGGTISYSLVSGPGSEDYALFNIGSSSGVVTFKNPPNFEAPADFGGNNVYDIVVQATDNDGNSSPQHVAITVTNVTESGTVAITSGSSASAAENQTGAGYTVAATSSLGSGAAFTYALAGGADVALFNINSANGVVTFKNAPNFEAPADSGGDNTYNINVTATDNDGNTAAAKGIAITVTNVAESGTVTITSGSTASTPENQTATGYAVAATSTIGGDATFTYALSGGADQALFNIDSGTGTVSFKSAPNFEAPADSGGDNVYDIQVEATDNDGNSMTRSVAVAVTNVAETVPVNITSGGGGATHSFTVPENTAGTIYTVVASGGVGSAFTYTISGGNDTADFAIDSATGALRFATPPDYENPADANTDNVYLVTVRAADGDNNADTQALTVTVTNVNETATVTISSGGGGATHSFSVAENTAGTVYTVAASGGSGGALTYSISAGTDAGDFSIDSSSGALSFAPAPNFEGPADANTNNVYLVTVRAADGDNNADTQALTVTVTNVNETATVTISSGGGGATYSFSVAENTAGTVYTVAASGGSGGALTYSISADTDAGDFSIDSSSGALSFAPAPNFESPTDANTDNVYLVTVRAVDGDNNADTQALTITVTNTNESGTVTVTSAASVSMPENQTATGYTATATSTIGGGATFTYAISSGADQNLFNIDTNTGIVTFKSAPDYESPADSGGDNVYNIVVRATDNDGNSNTKAVAITVVNLAETNAVTIDSGGGGATHSFSVAENTAGTVYTVAASGGSGGALTYSISAGTDAGDFSIDSSSGALSFAPAPNFESPADANTDNVYLVTVRTVDGDNNADTQALTITVTNVAEVNAVTISSGGGGATHSFAVDENTAGTIYTVAAGGGSGGALTYSISGGDDSGDFSIDSASGALNFVTPPDYEIPVDANLDNIYLVTVQAADGDSNTDTQALTITVNNTAARAAPQTTPDSGSVTADAGTTVSALAARGTFIAPTVSTDVSGNVLANDTDDKDSPAELTVTAVAGVSTSPLNGTYGLLSWQTNGDYHYALDIDDPDTRALAARETAPDTFIYAVRDTDGNTASGTLTIAVTGSNDAPVAAGSCTSTPQERALSGQLGASDVDTPAGELTFRLAPGGTPAKGSVSITADGRYTYTPSNPGARGRDQFVFEVDDGHGGVASGMETVIIHQKVMALGDSLTAGLIDGATGTPASDQRGGYRLPLWDALNADGYTVDFVGGESDGQGISLFDADHEGHIGVGITTITGNASAWLDANPADVLLVQVGSDEFASGSTPGAAEMGALLDKIGTWQTSAGGNPVTVLLARITDQAPFDGSITGFNDAVAAMTALRSGQDIEMVDLENALAYPSDLQNGVHPTDNGYRSMAEAWRKALEPRLDRCP